MRRKHLRNMCADLLKARWDSPEGDAREEFVALEDISASGACIALEEPIPVGTVVRLEHPHAEYRGEVRYCVLRHELYFVGMQFSEGSRWSPCDYTPSHLLQFMPRK